MLSILVICLGFFMGWTVCSVPLTLFGAPFGALWIGLAGGFSGAWLGWRSRDLLSALLLVTPEPRSNTGRVISIDLGIMSVVVIGVLGTTAFFIPTGDARPLWFISLMSAIFLLWRTRDTSLEKPVHWSGQNAPSLMVVLLLGLGLLLAYIALLRPDGDDAFYLNLPMGIATATHGMLVWDTMYGASEWPILGSNYRVEALQTLIAAIAWASGLSVVFVAHFVLPTIWCLIWAVTLALIGTSLFGKNWWVFAILSVLSTFVFAGTLQSWGVHGVTRLFHGKAPLILIVIPLLFILTYRADVLNAPLRRIIPVQAGLIIVAIGLTANAIYLAPLVLGLATCASWITRGFRTPRRLWVLMAVAPAVIVGLWLMFFDTPVTVPIDENRIFSGLALWNMFPSKLLLGLMVLTVLCGLLVGMLMPSARFLTACFASALLFALNPLLWPLYDGFVTGGLNFRLWWALPIPFLFAILLSWVVIQFDRLVWLFPMTIVTLLVLSFVSTGLLGMPGTQISLSLTKHPAEQSDVAQRVIEISQGKKVLAVEDIAAWIPTFENHPPQVYIRQIYLDQNMTVVAAADLEPRNILYKWINNEVDIDLDGLSQALTHQCPEVILISRYNRPYEFDAFVRRYHAVLVVEMQNYQVYEVPCERYVN